MGGAGVRGGGKMEIPVLERQKRSKRFPMKLLFFKAVKTCTELFSLFFIATKNM